MMIKLLFVLLLGLTGCSMHHNIQLRSSLEKAEAGIYTWDFGTVKESAIVKHEFAFKNNSAKILNIRNVSTSCGCAISKVDKKMLISGDTALIEVQFNSKGYDGATQQFIYVETDDINNSIVKFVIKADVRK